MDFEAIKNFVIYKSGEFIEDVDDITPTFAELTKDSETYVNPFFDIDYIKTESGYKATLMNKRKNIITLDNIIRDAETLYYVRMYLIIMADMLYEAMPLDDEILWLKGYELDEGANCWRKYKDNEKIVVTKTDIPHVTYIYQKNGEIHKYYFDCLFIGDFDKRIAELRKKNISQN